MKALSNVWLGMYISELDIGVNSIEEFLKSQKILINKFLLKKSSTVAAHFEPPLVKSRT